MKEMFNRRQRFSFAKVQRWRLFCITRDSAFCCRSSTVAADGVSASTDTSKETVESVQPEADQAPQDTATTAPGETYAQGAPAPKVELPNPALAAEAKAATETPATPEAKPAVEATPKAEVASKPATAEAGVTAEEAAKPATAEAKQAATDAKPATDESNKPRVRGRRAATDHNNEPVAVANFLKVR